MPHLVDTISEVQQQTAKKRRTMTAEVLSREVVTNLKETVLYTVSVDGQTRSVQSSSSEIYPPGTRVVVSETAEGLHLVGVESMQARKTVPTVIVNG